MDPLAVELNAALQRGAPETFALLSDLGRRLYFPKGILSQTAEAREKAHRYNATIGMATEDGQPMHLGCIQQHLAGLAPKDTYTYAPAAGRPDLREAWRRKLLAENPSMRGVKFSLPVVTHALTHGLSIVADLFVDPGDVVVLPAHFWGNYRLIYGVRRGAELRTFATYTAEGGFNVAGLRQTLGQAGRDRGKAIAVLNFPNNPTGYTPTLAEADAIAEALVATAADGVRVLAVTDDAYFGLTYEAGLLEESLFGRLVGRHPRLTAVKLCGPTKELYVWGFRVGFLTFGVGVPEPEEAVFDALVKKTMGTIRGTISNVSHLAQTLTLKALESAELAGQRRQKYEVLAARARRCRQVLADRRFAEAWEVYPFNSGYFLCLRLRQADAETLRVHLLNRYGVGVIASGKTDIRVAFSCLGEEQIADLFEILYRAAREVSGGGRPR